MPSFNDVLARIETIANSNTPDARRAPDIVRQTAIADMHAHTQRNIIIYYSGFLSAPPTVNFLNIDDMDKNGFMNAIEGMDCSKDLDLILHTPGGSITAAESIVYYLKKKFSHIRTIIPQMAMSAGTMIACGTDEIVLGHQSCIGPFDPSIQGVSAFSVLDEFIRATEDLSQSPHNLPLWQTLISKYPPAFLEQCRKAIELTNTIVPNWLSEKMLSSLEVEERDRIIKNILKTLNNPQHTKDHSRHIHFDEAKALGLNITQLEDDQVLQEKALTVHHACIATLMLTKTAKLIESHQNKNLVLLY